jgi:hypothetical protein
MTTTFTIVEMTARKGQQNAFTYEYTPAEVHEKAGMSVGPDSDHASIRRAAALSQSKGAALVAYLADFGSEIGFEPGPLWTPGPCLASHGDWAIWEVNGHRVKVVEVA